MPNDKPHAVPGSEKDRADGWYWAKLRKEKMWHPYAWCEGSWVVGEHLICDALFSEIGPRIPSPDEQPAPVERPVELADAEGLLALCDKATPGPWKLDPNYQMYIWGPKGQMVADDGGDEEGTLTRMRGVGANLPLKDNGNFIAASRLALPAAIRYALDLEAQVRLLQADKERLDWLQESGWKSTRAMFQQDGGFLVDDEGQVMPGTHDAGYEHRYLREAIDTAKGGKL